MYDKFGAKECWHLLGWTAQNYKIFVVESEAFQDMALFSFYTEWGIKISHFSKGHCAGCSGGREVGVVSCGWLASIIVSTHNGLDR